MNKDINLRDMNREYHRYQCQLPLSPFDLESRFKFTMRFACICGEQ